MKIQVNTDSSVDGGDALTAKLETTIHAALDRYGERLTRVEAHLGDEDGQSGDGPRGFRCLLEARPSGRGKNVTIALGRGAPPAVTVPVRVPMSPLLQPTNITTHSNKPGVANFTIGYS